VPRSRSSKFRAEPEHARDVDAFLRTERGLSHLHARRRADLITIESGPEGDRSPHARLRRVGVHRWQLEMATHDGRWQPTPLRASMEELLVMLVDEFGWTLQQLG